jgi:signal transduction histidine kinase
VAVPLVLALVGGVVWVVTGRALAPVERLRRQVDAVDATDLGQRVDPGANDELGALADTMNRLLDRIQQAQIAQRRFVSDASHELRSPLATIRQHAELAAAHPAASSLESLSEVALEEGARMQELVEGLLLLARLDERHRRTTAEIDLDDLALAEAARLRGLGVDVDARSIGPGRVVGDEALLRRVVRNLGDNAARHAARAVTLRVASLGDRVRLEVEDDGAGIPPEERERVFERFARLDEGRARDEGGSGLGLAIVREVVLAHGGAVEAGRGALGGALLAFTLPAAPRA